MAKYNLVGLEQPDELQSSPSTCSGRTDSFHSVISFLAKQSSTSDAIIKLKHISFGFLKKVNNDLRSICVEPK